MENLVPNLDAMASDDLLTFWQLHRHGRDAAGLGLSGRGSRNAMAALADYASNKATAMQCRARGDIPSALMYEEICERIYAKLPASIRW